jgi:hypothetical protein
MSFMLLACLLLVASLQLLTHRMLLASLSLFVRDLPGMSTVAGVPSVLTTLLSLAPLLMLLVRYAPGIFDGSGTSAVAVV